jgi:hypothetical protein
MKSKLLSLGVAMTLACGLAQAEEAKTKYKPGKGYTWETEDGANKINIGGRIQARYTNTDYDSARGKDDSSDFEAKRVRVHLKGHVFDDVKYKFQADFGDGRSGDNLKDAVLTYARHSEAQVSVGQFKTRLGHQEYTSSGKQQLVDRNIATKAFDVGRDIGAMLHGELADNKFEYNLGIFNGEGEGGSNKNDGHLLVGRISFQPLGKFGYSEGDLKRGDNRLIFSLGAATNDDLIDSFSDKGDADGDGDTSESVGTLEDIETFVATFGFRGNGVYLMGEYFWQDSDTTSLWSDLDGALSNTTTNVDSEGWYFQIGYLFPHDWELAARYALVDPDTRLSDDEETEFILGFNKFFMGVGHSLKLSLDLSWLEEETGPGTTYDDFRVRLQGQIVF